MNKIFSNFNKKIAFKFPFIIFIFSLVYVMFTSSLEMYYEHKDEYIAVEKRLNEISESTVSNLSIDLWTFDEVALDTELSNLVEFHNITYVELRTNNVVMKHYGKKVSKNMLEKNLKLTYEKVAGEMFVIGELYIQVDFTPIDEQIYKKVLIQSSIQFIQSLLIIIVILFLFSYFITRHLNTIVE